jgi:hypothetical protein
LLEHCASKTNLELAALQHLEGCQKTRKVYRSRPGVLWSEVRHGYLVCGNSGRSNQTVSIRGFVLHRFDVWVHPFTKFQRTW